MKNIFGQSSRATVAVLAFLLMASAVPHASAQTGAAVAQLQGHARYSTDSKTWLPLKKGDVLGSGALIQTGDKTTLDLTLGGQSQAAENLSPLGDGPGAGSLRVNQSSLLQIEKLSFGRIEDQSPDDIQLDLRAGQIQGNVRAAASGSRYEVKFPKGVVGIKEGSYGLDSAGALSVYSGAAVISAAVVGGSLETKVVRSGQQIYPNTGQISGIGTQKTPAPVAPPVPRPPAAPALPMNGTNGMGGAMRRF